MGRLKAALEAAADCPRDGRRLLSAYLRADWREQLAEQGARTPAGCSRAAPSAPAATLPRCALRASAILAGTDIGVLNVFPGRSMHAELALLVQDAGMTPFEALRAATVHAAAVIGLDREQGSIEAGKTRTWSCSMANPLADIASFRGFPASSCEAATSIARLSTASSTTWRVARRRGERLAEGAKAVGTKLLPVQSNDAGATCVSRWLFYAIRLADQTAIRLFQRPPHDLRPGHVCVSAQAFELGRRHN